MLTIFQAQGFANLLFLVFWDRQRIADALLQSLMSNSTGVGVLRRRAILNNIHVCFSGASKFLLNRCQLNFAQRFLTLFQHRSAIGFELVWRRCGLCCRCIRMCLLLCFPTPSPLPPPLSPLFKIYTVSYTT